MPRRRFPAVGPEQKTVEQYEHRGKKRANNPPVGLVTPESDRDEPKKAYAYDPHLDPRLEWSGKAERTSFEVPTVSLHVHERIDPRTILEAVKRKETGPIQASLFDAPSENPPLREALDFYKHQHGWSNRLLAGDSLLVMNSLLEKEGLAEQVQAVYIDPPYGVRYGSNFQPFVNKRDVKDGQDGDLTREPEMVRAFRDTWQLGIHSYLSYLRDRLLLSRQLLNPSGSAFVQIGDDNVHLARALMDEVFGAENFVSLISFRTKVPLGPTYLANIADWLLWYARDKKLLKFRRLFATRRTGLSTVFEHLQLRDGTRRRLSDNELQGEEPIPDGARLFTLVDLLSSGNTLSCRYDFELEGRRFSPPPNNSWKTTADGMKRLIASGRVAIQGKTPRYVFFAEDYPVTELTNQWIDTQGAVGKIYAVQTATKVLERCLLMSTDPGDLVLDPTCGSGTTAYVAEKWGRRWITADTSRVAITLAKQRLMTSVFEYYQLAHPDEGIASGLRYKTVPHVTLGSIANSEPAADEQLYDQPLVDRSKVRVAGPFTIEAVPAPVVRPVEDLPDQAADDASVARSGTTFRQAEWRAHIARAGIRARSGTKIEFSNVEPQGGTRYLSAVGETKETKSQRVAISFGPEHAPLEQRQVELAWEEARGLSPRPDILVFAAFQFDSEAAKDIDELDPKKTGMTFLRVQMDPDLLVDDLRKKSAGDHSFWLIGQPDVQLRKVSASSRLKSLASTITTHAPGPLSRATHRRSRCGCSIRTTTDEASCRVKFSSQWPARRTAGPSSRRI